jgi:polyphenol oxidase
MTFGSSLLAAIPGLHHAFFTREGGVSREIYESLNGGLGSNDDPANVLENRRRMAEQMGVAPEHFISVHQIHSPDAVVATGPWPGDTRPRADAIVTRTEGIAIGVTAADCGPILFADAGARVIGAAHAGWKGALTGVLESTIDAMEKLGADRSGASWMPTQKMPRSSFPRFDQAMRCSTSPASSARGWRVPAC